MRIFKGAILAFLFIPLCVACQKSNPIVEIQTSKGQLKLEIFVDQAPITAGNFMHLVREGAYEGGTFYRSVRNSMDKNPIPISVVQGGVARGANGMKIEAIQHENTDQTGLSHTHGTISMARSDTGTARGEFFICVGENLDLDFRGRRNPDGQGFAAFGRLIEGEKALQAIWGSSAMGEYLDPKIKIYTIKEVK